MTILSSGQTKSSAQGDLHIVLSTFAELGLPVGESKLEGPATCLTFLGFEIDSVLLEMRMPKDKLHDLQVATSAWAGRRSCRKKELESLVGKLVHASRAVHPGNISPGSFQTGEGNTQGFPPYPDERSGVPTSTGGLFLPRCGMVCP